METIKKHASPKISFSTCTTREVLKLIGERGGRAGVTGYRKVAYPTFNTNDTFMRVSQRSLWDEWPE